MTEKFKREITFQPAYDKRNPEPSKNYGIHGVKFRFVLKGRKGAVQFVVATNWMLPHVQKEMDAKPFDSGYLFHKPFPVDLGYHSKSPIRDWQEKIHPSFEKCQILEGKPCWYDGSGLNAHPVFEILLKEGSEGVWRELERYYSQTFSEAKP